MAGGLKTYGVVQRHPGVFFIVPGGCDVTLLHCTRMHGSVFWCIAQIFELFTELIGRQPIIAMVSLMSAVGATGNLESTGSA
jgi:hypothetical protein